MKHICFTNKHIVSRILYKKKNFEYLVYTIAIVLEILEDIPGKFGINVGKYF